jgi:ACDE family multidrug resistance protein
VSLPLDRQTISQVSATRVKPINHFAFAGLFSCLSLTRGILLSVLPLRALELLGDAQSVSVLFFAVSIIGIVTALTQHLMIRLLGSYHTYLLAVYSMALCAPLMAMDNVWGLLLGMVLHYFAVAALEVVSSLYVMHCIKRRELTKFEPIRVFAVVIPLTIGPVLGVYLSTRISDLTPFIITAMAALLSFVYFRALGLHHIRLLESRNQSGNPITLIKRYAAQPRLRLAWGLALARSSWWVTFIIYTPIFLHNAGIDDLVGAAVVSIGTAWTLTVPLWGWLGRVKGLRFLLTLGYTCAGLLTGVVFLFAGDAYLMAGLLVVAALGATILDGAGNVLFFRAVRPLERGEMTGIFLTYRDIGQLAPPGLFAVMLKFLALPTVFIAAAVWMLAGAGLSRHIPKRM